MPSRQEICFGGIFFVYLQKKNKKWNCLTAQNLGRDL